MPVDFTQRAAAVQQQLAEVQAELQAATTRPERLRLKALQASLVRSLRWYTARAGTRSDRNALSVLVADDITTSSDV